MQVLGMSWDEVHDEAERLEHAASDRVIDRIDAMLGRPSADPHGDPIPDPEGTVAAQEYHTLLTCPVGAPVVMMRVTDQDAEFLRFLESSDLKPGQTVRVEVRDSAADQVVVRGKNDRQITIGMRAAAKTTGDACRRVTPRIPRPTCTGDSAVGPAGLQCATSGHRPAPTTTVKRQLKRFPDID